MVCVKSQYHRVMSKHFWQRFLANWYISKYYESMIDIELLRKEPKRVKQNLARRGVEGKDVDKLAEADGKWREVRQRVDELQGEQNKASEKVVKASSEEKKALIEEMRGHKAKLKETQEELEALEAEREKLWRGLPNLVADDVPEGGEEDAEVIEEKKVPEKDFPLKSYLELAEGTQIDLARAGKVSGSRFAYLKGNLARLQMALVSWAFDKLSEAGFEPVIPPMLITEEAMAGMGYLDRHAEEIYRTQDNLFLIGTSEQSIGPMFMDETLKQEELPKRYVGYSTCFRREAGSHGADVKGILRMHQFDKVEMFSFASAVGGASEAEHQFLLEQQRKIMDALQLPYRVVKLAAGDLGNPSAKTYDIQAWIPSEGKWRETHSTSNTTDYQARRLGIRGVHMLNGTAIAVGRMLIAILEHYQQADGSVNVPEVLRDYVAFAKIVG